MQIVDKRDPTHILGEIDAAASAALQSLHAGGADERDREFASTAIRETRARGAWIRCRCSLSGPLLAPARLAETYYLRRLTARAAHAPDCVFADAAIIDNRRDGVGHRIRPDSREPCRPLHRQYHDREEPSPTRRQRQRPAPPVLARQLWRILELAGLNRIEADEKDGPETTLSSQLAAIRRAARQVQVGNNVRLDEVLSTYPGDIGPGSPWQTKALHCWTRFQRNEQPQALMIGLARSIDGCDLTTAAGMIRCETEVVLLSADQRNAGPPFLFMLAGIIDPHRDRIAPVRAFAQPVLLISRLIPVESAQERRMLVAVLAFRQHANRRFPSLRFTLEKPLFDIETNQGWLRPPLRLMLSNVRTGRTEQLALRNEAQGGLDLPERDSPIGRVLAIPNKVLAADAAAQAAWFIDVIFGARTDPAPRFGSAQWESGHVAPAS